MRIEHLRLRNIASLREVFVDFSAMPPGLIAVRGDNGSGKTFLLESIISALFRKLPARNNANPVDCATSRESFIDLVFCLDARRLRARLSLDGEKRKSDAVLLDVTAGDALGVPLNDGKISTFDREIENLLPSYELVLNSVFAAQGRGDEFARTSGSGRKDLFAEFLGLQALLTKAAHAGEAEQLCADAVFRLTTSIETIETNTAAPVAAELERWAEELHAKGAAAELAVRDQKAAIVDLETRATLATDSEAAYAAAVQQRTTVERSLADQRQALATLQRERTQAEQGFTREQQAIQQRQQTLEADVEKRLAANAGLQAQKAAIDEAVKVLAQTTDELVRLRDEERAAQVAYDTARHDLAEAEQAVSAFTLPQDNLARAQRDSALLETVPCGGAGEYAACQFLVNATAAAARIADLEAHVAGITAAFATRDDLLNQSVASKTALDTVKGRISAAEQQAKPHEALARLAPNLAAAESRIAELTAKRTEAQADTVRQLAALDTSHVEQLTLLTAREVSHVGTLTRLGQELAAAVADLEAAESGNSLATQLRTELATARATLEQATRVVGEVESSRAELARRRQALTDQRAKLETLRDRRTHAENEQLEWGFLKKALGKGGLPDLEIDAAGPTISALTNELLVASYGPRFALELVTQVQKAGGAGMKDQFTVRVLDAEATDGRPWRDISELSGGEKVVVQEAFMCALSLYVNERAPLPMRTLFRDETGAALDSENALRYVAMLRRVREIGGFHQIFFISHNPAAAALADVQLQVHDGQVDIVHAPFDVPEAA